MTTESRPETMLLMGERAFQLGFDEARLKRLGSIASLTDLVQTNTLDTPAAQARLAEVEVLLTGWGTPRIDLSVLDGAPHLRAVLHTAGSVKTFADRACWDRGLLITTAAEANAVPVAEYTLAAILFAGKRAHQAAHAFAAHRGHCQPPAGIRSNYQRTIGIIGYSRIGRRVVDLLRPFDLEVLVADPYADPTQVAAAGAQLVDLDTLLVSSDIVSVHAPALPSTRHMLNRERLALIRDHGTVINTARGMIIDTGALEVECASGRLSAVLDVTDPEPLRVDSLLWQLPNAFVTPHIAGAQDTEVHRLVDTALDELERYRQGEPPAFAVTADDLPLIA